MLTTRKIKIINKKKFLATALNKKDKTFVVYMATFSINFNIYAFWQAEIFLLEIEKVTISSKYTDYINVFSLDSAAELPKDTGINNYFTDLIDNKQLFYNPIYSLGSIKLEMLKIYIEINVANSFIKPFKLSAGILILFIKKKKSSFWLCVDY